MDFDYSVIDNIPEHQHVEAPATQKKYTEHIGADSSILRSEDVRASTRVPKSIVKLGSDSTESNELLGGQNDANSSLGLLDEKLLHQKEIEELYGEIMKTINEDQLFAENGKFGRDLTVNF